MTSYRPPKTMAPVFPPFDRDHGYLNPRPAESILDRTIDHITQRLATEDHPITLHLFAPREQDKQCLELNKRLTDRFIREILEDQLVLEHVDPEDWGFKPKGKGVNKL